MALTACILEMSGSMNMLLPKGLLNLSKISSTVHMAIPVLEFLSTLMLSVKIFVRNAWRLLPGNWLRGSVSFLEDKLKD